MEEFVNIENKPTMYRPWLVLSQENVHSILKNIQFQNFIADYFGKVIRHQMETTILQPLIEKECRIIEQKRLEEQRRMENKRRVAEQKQLIEQRHREEERWRSDQRQLEEQRHQETERRILEQRNLIMPVVAAQGQVSQAFAALGPMHEAAGLIWSWAAPDLMNHYDAEIYCKTLRARLPSKQEFEALIKILSPNGQYDRDLFPIPRVKYGGMEFWSSSILVRDPILYYVLFYRDAAHSFSVDFGSVWSSSRKETVHTVLCVAPRR